MRTLTQSGTNRLSLVSSLAGTGGILVLIAAAASIGIILANGSWLYLALLIAVVIALQWPVEAALGVYAFLFPFESIAMLGNSASGGMSVNRVLGAVAAMALLATGIVTKRLHWPTRPAWWWTAFVLWCAISAVWALQLQPVLKMLPTAVSLLALYLVAVSWKLTKEQYSFITKCVIAGALLAALFVIYQYRGGVTYKTWFGDSTGRASLVAGEREANPNHFGADLLLPFSLAVGLFFSAKKKLNMLVSLGVAGAIALAAFLTMSRGALLSVMVVVAVYVFRLGIRRRMLLVGAALLAALLAMPSNFFSRITASVATGGAGRMDIWVASGHLIKKYALLGAGLSNFPVAYNEFAGRAPLFRGFGRGAHNIYLEAFVELGVVGFVLLLAAAASHLRLLRKLRLARSERTMQVLALEAACWATLVNGFFEGGIWYKSFWLVWTLCLVLAGLIETKAEEPAVEASAAAAWN
jgi:hypothetical protein